MPDLSKIDLNSKSSAGTTNVENQLTHESPIVPAVVPKTLGAGNKDKATDESYVLERYGNFQVHLLDASALADRADQEVDAIFDRYAGTLDTRGGLTARERSELAEWVASVKVVTTDTGLRVTSGVFEVTGAKATSQEVGLDQFWRNIRTHTLHEPLAYKNRELGRFELLDEIPEATWYTCSSCFGFIILSSLALFAGKPELGIIDQPGDRGRQRWQVEVLIGAFFVNSVARFERNQSGEVGCEMAALSARHLPLLAISYPVPLLLGSIIVPRIVLSFGGGGRPYAGKWIMVRFSDILFVFAVWIHFQTKASSVESL